MASLDRFWKLDRTERRRLGETLGPIKTVTDLLADVLEATKDNKAITDVAEAIRDAVPWGAVLGAAAEAVTPIRFLVKLFKGLTEETDPKALGFLACTMAYQRSVEQAIKDLGDPRAVGAAKSKIREELEALGPDKDEELDKFDFRDALRHPFVLDADSRLQIFARGLGYDEEQTRLLINKVHQLFVPNLKAILSDGKLREKFQPFLTLTQLGADEKRAYQSLNDHIAYQLWKYEDASVFEGEPFALKDIYVATECGALLWEDIRSGVQRGAQDRTPKGRLDAFAEENGGRHDLIDMVMTYIRDPDFEEAVVVQGVAGSGKSSFTYRLFWQLILEGFRPIRVQIRDLRLDQDISEALPRAIPIGGPGYQPESPRYTKPDDVLKRGAIFNETIGARDGRQICPYVLILDGWDEVSIAVSEGFGDRVARMLEQVRNEYLKRDVPVRVVLTGRPSDAFTDSRFLRGNTPVLTIRPLKPDHLESYVGKLVEIFGWNKGSKSDEAKIDQFLGRFQSVFKAYREGFDWIQTRARRLATDQFARSDLGNLPGSMEVLGLPLLAHLAVRLIDSEAALSSSDIEALVANPTELYRRLVDLTCQGAGQVEALAPDMEGSYRYWGDELRRLLQHTAEAMTVYGKENIPSDELELRLEDTFPDLFKVADRAARENALAKLMIGFYFTGGHRELGCEFMHKSFKEYLFAERIVEELKRYGSECKNPSLPERAGLGASSPDGNDRYWADFPEGDIRQRCSRDLARLLSPAWITPEVAAHLQVLIPWEISRDSIASRTGTPGFSTRPIKYDEWLRVRDGLADVWDWWADGVHLRPQLYTRHGKLEGHEDVIALELVRWAIPLDYKKNMSVPAPPRIISLDGRFGDGLFRLTALVHFGIAERDGWLEGTEKYRPVPSANELWDGVSPIGRGPRPCQSLIRRENKSWVLFAPSGRDPRYFSNYTARINGDGWRPSGPFPLGVDLRGLDLRVVTLAIPKPTRDSRYSTNWFFANLSECNASGSSFVGHTFRLVLAKNALFDRADLSNCLFDWSDCQGASFRLSRIIDSSFYCCDLRDTDFSQTWLDAGFKGSSMTGSIWDGTWRPPEADPEAAAGELSAQGKSGVISE